MKIFRACVFNFLIVAMLLPLLGIFLPIQTLSCALCKMNDPLSCQIAGHNCTRSFGIENYCNSSIKIFQNFTQKDNSADSKIKHQCQMVQTILNVSVNKHFMDEGKISPSDSSLGNRSAKSDRTEFTRSLDLLDPPPKTQTL